MCVVVVVLVFVFTSNFVVAKQNYTSEMQKSSTTSDQLDICSKMYPAQISNEKSSFS